jgi:hypothetical protein
MPGGPVPAPAPTEDRAIRCPMSLLRPITAAFCCAMGAVWGHGGAAEQVTMSTATAANIAAQAADPGGAQLASWYRQMEDSLLNRGHLRQDRNPRGARLDADRLKSSFMRIAMHAEYAMRGGGMHRSGHAMPLRRWEEPVRLGVRFGASVHPAQQRADLATVRDTARRIGAATGHPVAVTANAPNFHVLIVSDRERAGLAPHLRELMPGLSRSAVNAVTGMGRNTFCLVIAAPDPRGAYVRAVAVVRAEHPPRMRQSCIEEELAQGMGLSNDSGEVWPSIFNDDEEFGVLTRHDALLLEMLYLPSLRPGLTPDQVQQVLPAIVAQVAQRG